MRIAVCDDSLIDQELTCSLLHLYFSKRSLQAELVPYEDGMNLLYDVQEENWFDIIFLDIYLNHLLGIDVARKLRELDYKGKIIFLTGSPDFAVDSYDVGAYNYVLKPIGYEKLSSIMDRIVENPDLDAYQIKRRSNIIRVPFDEILYVESSNTKCILHRKDGSAYTIYKRLSEIQEELSDGRFLRCHQSYLVNMDYIQQVSKQFELITGDIIHIRQRDLKTIRQIYLDYIEGKVKHQRVPMDEERNAKDVPSATVK